MAGGRAIIAKACGWLAALCVAGMMMVTVVDVSLRWLINFPVRGTVEIVELLLTGTFFLALPAVFLREENIVVDVIDRLLGAGGVDALKRLAALLAVAALGVMAWQGWIAAQDTLVFGDVTSDLSIPKIYYWMPLLAGLAGALVSALFMAFARSRKAP